MNISCIHIHKITKFYYIYKIVLNGKNSSNKEQIVRVLEKQYVKLKMKSLVISHKFDWD